MAIVTVYNNEYECHRAVKGKDCVFLYDADGNEILTCQGISDFAGYEIEGGQWEIAPPTERERLDAIEAAMLGMILMQSGGDE